ncbi:MAG TPA: response regulator transcription factor [bacterium]|nr:response regulator transcription factor [bacterium]
MPSLDFREKATASILRAAYEASTWEEFGAQAVTSLDQLFNTSLSILFRSDERGPVIASAGAIEIHLQWAEKYFHCDPMIPAISARNQGLLQASDCPEWRAFLKAPVYVDLAKSCGVHDYFMFRFSEAQPYKSGCVQLLLARGHHQASFNREERRRAESLLPPLQALGRWIDRSRILSDSCSTLEGVLDSEGRPKIAFDIDGKLLCASRTAEKLVGLETRGRFRISEELRAAVRRFGDLVKERSSEAPSPQVALYGKNAQPIQVTLRLAKTRSGNPFVLAEVERADLLAQIPQLGEVAQRYGLTKTETEVLRLLAQGLTDQEIAQRLFISRDTVHTHAGHLFGKLGVNSRLQAALVAHGLPFNREYFSN